MSVMFGRWNFEGRSASPDYWMKVRNALAAYGPDGCQSHSDEGLEVLYYPFPTTAEARREVQPLVTKSGAVIGWDGRLDNRDELIRQLGVSSSSPREDVFLVATAYEHRGAQCFPDLVGDWALFVFDPNDRSLTLARDPIGTRHLYYTSDGENVTWSTVLDPLVLFSETVTLNEEYIAGWFSSFPGTHLTPYAGIYAVPPSSLVTLRPKGRIVHRYWNFDPHREIRYRTDDEYEEHFRVVFAESVRRRMRSHCPVLAELSGGMDSSSIACMADSLIKAGGVQPRRLDTISFYDGSEPNWNEQPFFTKVEERLGRTGCHIDICGDEIFQLPGKAAPFSATPTHSSRTSRAAREFAACISHNQNRVVLSGLGGDEMTGGVPTPTPELADLLVAGRLRVLAHRLLLWSLDKRKPWFHLFFETCRAFLPRVLVATRKDWLPAPWLQPAFLDRNRATFANPERRLKLFGPLPSFQENLNTVELLRRQLATETLSQEPLYEIRYPYLDRDLLEFLFAVPREQLVRPGQRRSLMRRALAGLVPNEILNRKRKAYASRAPATAIAHLFSSLVEKLPHMVSVSLGMVDEKALRKALRHAKDGREVPIIFLARTLAIECWLESLGRLGSSFSIPRGFREQQLERGKPEIVTSGRSTIRRNLPMESTASHEASAAPAKHLLS